MTQGFSRRSLVVCSVLLLLAVALTFIRKSPPRPQPASAPAASFSAERAITILDDLVADGKPHPIGSDANRMVRDRIIDHLQKVGLEPYLQRAFVCAEYGTCGTVENIVARVFGQSQGRAVLLAAHYDSVGAGPGASDDGVGAAAIIEIARALNNGPPLRNDVVLLIDDGEEAGLLGAEAFASAHPWAADVGAVINLEARGTSGRSFLFETSDDNSWLIDLARTSIPTPATSSLFYTVYKQLPNDSDYSVFKRYGMPGVNFAFIGDVARYHTPKDDVAHADPGSIQHQGDNALAMVRALGNAGLTGNSRETSSWFDVFGWFIIRWPEPWNLPLGAVAFVGSVACIAVARQRYRVSLLDLARAFVWWAAAWMLTALVAHLFVSWLHKTTAILYQFPVHAGGGILGLWILGFAMPTLIWALSGDWFSGKALWCVGLVWLSLGGIALSLILPGVAYLFLLPALGGSIIGLIGLMSRVDSLTLGGASALAAIVMFPIAGGIWDGLGTRAAGALTAMVAVIGMLVLPALLELRTIPLGRVAAALCGFALGLILAGFTSPAFSESSPAGLNVSYLQDPEEGKAFWMMARRPGGIPREMREAARWVDGVVRPYGWFEPSPRYYAAPAPAVSAPAPRLDVVDSRTNGKGGRTVTLRFRSPRGAPRGTIILDLARISDLYVGDQRFDLAWARGRGRMRSTLGRIAVATVPPEGLAMTLSTIDNDPIEVTIIDESYGLPVGGDAVVASRPAWATQISSGDTTIMRSRTTI